MNPRAISYANLALCILLWASIPVASKKILSELTNLQMLFWSSAFSVVALGSLTLLRGKLFLLTGLRGREIVRLAGMGFLGAFLYYVLLYGAFALTSAAEAFILAYTWPILMALMAGPLLGERLTAVRLAAVAVSFCGVAVIVTQGRMVELKAENLPGNGLALCGAVVFALFSLLGKRSRHDASAASLVYFAAALACSALAVGLSGGSPQPSLPVWGWIAYNGLLVNGVSYFFWFKALEHGETVIVSNLLYLTPATSLLFIGLFLDEPIHPTALIGLLLIAGGILFQSWTALAARGAGRDAVG